MIKQCISGHGAKHHPTRAFHMLRGEAISWLYTLALLDAVFMMEKDLQSETAANLIQCIYIYLKIMS